MFSYCHHRHASPVPEAPALDMQGVSAHYPGHAPTLKNISIRINQGSCMAVVGSNGAGKSTLFKAAASLLPLSSGQVHIFGHPLGMCHHRVVYLPQRADIDWEFPMNVQALIETGRFVYLGWFKSLGSQDRDKVKQAMDIMQIADLAPRHISELSGGQQQRVLIARALVQNADLLMLDEPLNAVDRLTRDLVTRILHQLKKEGKTVLVATHYLDEELGLYDGAIYLKDGECVAKPKTHEHGEGCHHD